MRSEVKNKLFVGNLPRDLGKDALLLLLENEVKGEVFPWPFVLCPGVCCGFLERWGPALCAPFRKLASQPWRAVWVAMNLAASSHIGMS